MKNNSSVNNLSPEIIAPEVAVTKVNQGALLVDLRTPREIQEGFIPGATFINAEEISSRLHEFGDNKEREIVLYCKSGGRCDYVGQILKQIGYPNVFNALGYTDLKDHIK